ncbi:hypothetical protein B0T25DRAFT_563868 [Lasiosphaeria hispida]|uniref:Isopenicillin N synthase-like Fe(2+) 2OG dioxygenase domain-containing protein n=1 Tax=Lasiosphaeria hispida TaxID=260671 RepID=A0AAJ0HPG9_9PEZI|nr:hypothetical protein B0T25DRAFT_563868 [Lasiosphaeria hispida]
MPSGEKAEGALKLQVLSYERLKARDDDEVHKMVRALSDEGLFFLDMDGPSAGQSLQDLTPILRYQRAFFERAPEIKSKYKTDFRFQGFIPTDIGVELLRLSREECIQGTLDLPHDLRPVSANVLSTSSFIDGLLRDLAATLFAAMGLPPPALDPQQPGLSYLTLGISKAQRGTCLVEPHEDEGFLTLTFYDEPFLEVLDRTTREWKLLEVNEHMPIVNVALESQRRSNDRLYAPLHRVTHGENEIDLIMYDLYESPSRVV